MEYRIEKDSLGEVRVPADWNTVSYPTAGGTATASVYSRDGARFAMVDLVPGADGATVTTAIDRLNGPFFPCFFHARRV